MGLFSRSAASASPRDLLDGDALFRQLSRPGPFRVLRGDLALVGTPGVIYTPGEGSRLPAVAFAHGWLTGVGRYTSLLEHLASWGIVVVAPNTQRGPVPSHLELAGDLLKALDIVTTVRLGSGQLSVDARRLGLVGHGMGGGAAVLAAARQQVASVAALFPSVTAPAADQAATGVTAPALVVTGEDDSDDAIRHAYSLAAACAGDVTMRQVTDAAASGLVEGRRLLAVLGAGGKQPKTVKTTRTLLTGYLLATLAQEKKARIFTSDDMKFPRTRLLDPATPPPTPEPLSGTDLVRTLLGR